MQIVIRKTDVDGIGNVLKGFISAYSVHENTLIECNNNYVFGLYDTILDKRHIYDENQNEKEKNYFYTCRLLVLEKEENVQENISNEFTHTDRGSSIISPLYSKKVLIDWNYDVNKIAKPVYDRILKTIDRIVFRDDVMDMYNYFKSLIPICERSLGVSVRTWKCHHEKDVNRPYHSDVYKNKIREVVDSKPIDIIVLSTDNDSINDEYVSYCKMLKEDMKVVLLNDELKNIENPLQKVLLKIWMLSDCNEFICNRISTFSELVFWFGRCHQTVYPLF